MDRSDPTLLTSREIRDSWGSCTNFVWSYGLKPYDLGDLQEAAAISRALAENREEYSGGNSQGNSEYGSSSHGSYRGNGGSSGYRGNGNGWGGTSDYRGNGGSNNLRPHWGQF